MRESKCSQLMWPRSFVPTTTITTTAKWTKINSNFNKNKRKEFLIQIKRSFSLRIGLLRSFIWLVQYHSAHHASISICLIHTFPMLWNALRFQLKTNGSSLFATRFHLSMRVCDWWAGLRARVHVHQSTKCLTKKNDKATQRLFNWMGHPKNWFKIMPKYWKRKRKKCGARKHADQLCVYFFSLLLSDYIVWWNIVILLATVVDIILFLNPIWTADAESRLVCAPCATSTLPCVHSFWLLLFLFCFLSYENKTKSQTTSRNKCNVITWLFVWHMGVK